MNSRRLSLLLLTLAALAAVLPAQTNTFPSSGNVGIGTTAPATSLEIYSTDPVVSLVPPAGAFGRSSGIDFYGTFGYASNGDNGARRFAQIRVGSSSPLAWDGAYFSLLGITPDGGNPTELIHVNTASGNVGIGTASPNYRLHIMGGLIGLGSPYTTEFPDYGFGSPHLTTFGFQTDFGGQANPIVGTMRANDGTGFYELAFISKAIGSTDRALAFRSGTIGSGGTERWYLGASGGGAYFSGNVGIGTTNPTQKLSVNGTIQAKEVIVQTGWSDYVFAPDYRLPALSTVEAHIKAEKHLPGIPSAQEVAEQGISLGDMQAKLLAKIEEITLHQIAQEKRIEALSAENATLRREIESLKK